MPRHSGQQMSDFAWALAVTSPKTTLTWSSWITILCQFISLYNGEDLSLIIPENSSSSRWLSTSSSVRSPFWVLLHWAVSHWTSFRCCGPTLSWTSWELLPFAQSHMNQIKYPPVESAETTKWFCLKCGDRFSGKLSIRLLSWSFWCTSVAWCSSMRILISFILQLEISKPLSQQTALHWTQCYSIRSFSWTYLTRLTAESSMLTKSTYLRPSRHSITGSSGLF